MDLLDKLPPQNLEAEQSVLGAMLLGQNGEADDCAIAIRAEDFYKTTHATIFKAIVGLLEKGVRVDLVTLKDALAREGALEAVGGAAYLMELGDVVPSAANAPHYVALVRAAAQRRNLIAICSSVVRDCYEDRVTDAGAILDRAQSRLVEVLDRRTQAAHFHLRDLVDAEIARMHAQRVTPSVSTGYDSLDAMLGGGMRNGEFIILAARPSVGKTSMASAISRNVASQTVPVVFFSLEMPGRSIAQNLMAQAASTNAYMIRAGKLSTESVNGIAHACESLRRHPFYFVEANGMNIFAIATEARRRKLRGELGLIVIDYVGLIEGEGESENRNAEMSRISRAVKKLASQLDVPTLVLSQMSRDQEKSGRTRPQLSDLRDSGSLEQDADVVMFLHRAGYQKGEDQQKDGETTVIVAKNRNGPTGDVAFRFERETVRFTERRMS